jgi:2-phospho-L-lactate guanylyltransferase
MRAVLIPFKDLSQGKQRLGNLLGPAERGRLAWRMFEHVVDQVRLARGYELAVVISSFAPALELARASDFDVLVESEQRSESDSVDRGSRRLEERGVKTVLRLPSDLPLLQPADLELLLARASGARGALLVPSRDRRGTNALMRTPPTLFPSCFGPDSYGLHRAVAHSMAAPLEILELERLGLDIDEPEDLAALLALEDGGPVADYVRQRGIDARLPGPGRGLRPPPDR